MKNFILTLCTFASSYLVNAQEGNRPQNFQPKYGFKGGYNWSYVTGKEEGINFNNKNGFMASLFYATPSTGVGYRTEIVFSRQGYSFDNGGSNTDVLHDYIYLPQLTTYTFANRVQVQLGAQIGYLLNAKKITGSKDTSITDIMKRIDYGFAAGVEIYPMKKLIIGGRYNLGLGKLYKRDYTSPNPYPLPFNPETTNFKNAVVQVFMGLRF